MDRRDFPWPHAEGKLKAASELNKADQEDKEGNDQALTTPIDDNAVTESMETDAN